MIGKIAGMARSYGVYFKSAYGCHSECSISLDDSDEKVKFSCSLFFILSYKAVIRTLPGSSPLPALNVRPS